MSNPILSANFEKITSEQAEYYFAERAINRKFRPILARRYAQMMEAGDWKDFHPEPIIFDQEGQVIDGQHRLAAMSLSGHGYNVLAVRYAKSTVLNAYEIMPTLDRGTSRGPRDVLAIAYGEPDFSFWHAAIVKAVVVGATASKNIISDSVLLKAWERYGNDIKTVTLHYHSKGKLFSRAAVVAAVVHAYIYYKRQQELSRSNKVLYYADVLNSGIPSTDPTDRTILCYRNWIVSKIGSQLTAGTGVALANDLYLRCERSILNFVEGRIVTACRKAPHELFPLVGD